MKLLDAVLQADLAIRVQTLQAEIERLRAALTDLCNAADSTNYPMHGPTWDRLWNCAVTARKALTPHG